MERLGLDPALIEQRQKMLEQGRRREQDMEAWFGKLIKAFKGQRVKIGGTFADLYRVARAGLDKGMTCEFAPGSILMGGGGMKGYKDAPADWEEQVKYFFGVEKLGNQYGFSECIGNAPLIADGSIRRTLCLVRNSSRVVTHASVRCEDLTAKVLARLIEKKAWIAEPDSSLR